MANAFNIKEIVTCGRTPATRNCTRMSMKGSGGTKDKKQREINVILLGEILSINTLNFINILNRFFLEKL